MKRRSEALWLLGLLFAAGVAADEPKFYQAMEFRDPTAAVERLRTTGWVVRGNEPLMLDFPIDWASETVRDANWIAQLNAMNPLAPVFQSLAQGYDPELHELARLFFLDWIDFHIVRDQDHRYRWNDMTTGIRAAYLAQLIHYERVHGQTEAMQQLESAALKHLEVLSDPSNSTSSNHGMLQLVGVAALCEVLEPDLCAGPLTYAQERYQWLFARQFSREGIHLEHSPGYHLFALVTFDRIERSGLLELRPRNRAILELARSNLAHMIHPDGGFAEIGDTVADRARRAAQMDPGAAWLVSGGARGVRPLDGVALYPESGVISVRDLEAASFLYFSVAHNSRVHKHLDTGSFEWSDLGERILVDSGKWGYDETEERAYVRSASAHNLLVADGVDLSAGDVPEEPIPLRVEESAGIYLIETTLPAKRRLIDAEHVRLILLKPGGWLIVADLISEFLPSHHTQWFQFSPSTEIEKRGSDIRLRLASGRAMLVRSISSVDAAQQWRGSHSPMLGWYSPRYHELLPSWQIGFEQHGRRLQYVTLFRWESPDRAPIEPDWNLSERRLRVCWREGDRLFGSVVSLVGPDWMPMACSRSVSQ